MTKPDPGFDTLSDGSTLRPEPVTPVLANPELQAAYLDLLGLQAPVFGYTAEVATMYERKD